MKGRTWNKIQKPGLILGMAASLVCPGAVSLGSAQIYTLSDQNSSAQVNVGSQAGMFNWNIYNGLGYENVLNQQWFWVGINNSAPIAINAISAASSSQPDGRSLDTIYNSGSYSVEVDYLLTGGSMSSGQSDIGESITLKNTSSGALSFRFYQYSDFDMSGSPNSSDTVQLGKNLRGLYDLADQTYAGASLSETVATPGANEGEVALKGVTLAELNNGISPVTLNDNAGPLGPAPVTWAFEWDVTIASGGSFLISKDKAVTIPYIPEPSSMALVALGLAAFAVRRHVRAV